jgi:hypothetical protein
MAKTGSIATGSTFCGRIEMSCASDSARSSNGSRGPSKFVALNCCSDVGHDTGGNVDELS